MRETVSALDGMYAGGYSAPRASIIDPELLFDSPAAIALTGIERRLDQVIVPSNSPTPQEAMTALPGIGLSYTGEEEALSHVASSGQGQVALPRCQGEPRDVAELLGDEAASFVHSFETRIMYAPDEWELLRDELPEFVPYMDATLSTDPAKYNRFVAELASHHIVEFTQRPMARCSVFFVCKKNKDLRLICDPRSFNQRCRPPPHMPLGGAATSGRMRNPESETAFVAAADV